jgi:4-amino-4-deoxy-L-arabinose transferase-like glycosyltransferase
MPDPSPREETMFEPRRFSMGDAVLLVLILAGAAGARAWYVNTCCHQGADDGPYQVQDDWKAERDAIVRNIENGRGFIGPSHFRADQETPTIAFVYPWLLAMLDRLSHDLDVTYQRMRWIQVALGSLTAGLYFAFARRAFHNRLVATLAGLFSAIYPFWIINTAEINDGVLATFLLAFCLFLGVRGGQSGGALTSLLYGIGLAGLASLRAPLLPFAFAAILWFLWRSRNLPRGWLYALLAFLGFVNGLVPWVLQNIRPQAGAPPVAQSSTYRELWVGYNSRSTGGPQMQPAMAQALAEAQGQGEQGGQPGPMTPSQEVRELGRDIVDQIRTHPAKTLQRRLLAGLSFFFGERWLTDRELYREDPKSVEEVPEWLARSVATWLSGSLLIVLLLGALGWRWTYGWRREAMPSSLAVIWIFLPYFLAHAESLHGPRLPLDGVLICYTAFVLACIVPPVGRFLFRRTEVEA